MRKHTLLLALLFIGKLSFSQANAEKEIRQSTSSDRDSVVRDWVGILETRTEQEVHYSIVKCGDQQKVLLMYYNEWHKEKTVKIKFTVKYLGYVISEEKTMDLKTNQREKGNCTTQDNNLFISLPATWHDIEKVIVEAKQIN